VEACFGPFGESGNLDARSMHNLFWMHPMELLGDVGHVESCFGPLRDSVSVGARYMHGL
jgi:hypothetical protein